MTTENIATVKRFLQNESLRNLAGPRNAGIRQRMMECMTGVRMPKAKCGVNALESEVFKAANIDTGLCLARKWDAVDQWAHADKATNETL